MKRNRILLKLSGESLAGKSGPIDLVSLDYITCELKSVAGLAEIGVVVGGGNIWRGARKNTIARVPADFIGMYATILNGLALKEMLNNSDIKSEVFSAVGSGYGLNTDSPELSRKCLSEGKVAIFVGGTGHPYLTTDTAAALRALETGAHLLVKATQVDGVYDSDPKKNPTAKIYKVLSYDEALGRKLEIMDTSAFSLCRDNDLPIIVYNFYKKGSLKKIIAGERIGTIVSV